MKDFVAKACENVYYINILYTYFMLQNNTIYYGRIYVKYIMVVKVKRGNRHHSCSSVVYYTQRAKLDYYT